MLQDFLALRMKVLQHFRTVSKFASQHGVTSQRTRILIQATLLLKSQISQGYFTAPGMNKQKGELTIATGYYSYGL